MTITPEGNHGLNITFAIACGVLPEDRWRDARQELKLKGLNIVEFTGGNYINGRWLPPTAQNRFYRLKVLKHPQVRPLKVGSVTQCLREALMWLDLVEEKIPPKRRREYASITLYEGRIVALPVRKERKARSASNDLARARRRVGDLHHT